MEPGSFPRFLGVRAAIQEGKTCRLFALLFPLVGTGLLVWARSLDPALSKYGVSASNLPTTPGVIGRTLTGMVRAPARMQARRWFPGHPDRCTPGDDAKREERSTSERIIWKDERRVAGQPSRTAAAMETHIPRRLPASADVQPSKKATQQTGCFGGSAPGTAGCGLRVSIRVPVSGLGQ